VGPPAAASLNCFPILTVFAFSLYNLISSYGPTLPLEVGLRRTGHIQILECCSETHPSLAQYRPTQWTSTWPKRARLASAKSVHEHAHTATNQKRSVSGREVLNRARSAVKGQLQMPNEFYCFTFGWVAEYH
jgi:hypothetical protein